MELNSTNGKFSFSVPDFLNPAGAPEDFAGIEFIDEAEVTIMALKGQKVTLMDVAEFIWNEELHLMAKTLRCHLIVKNKNWKFSVSFPECSEDILKSIAEQFEL